MRLSLRLLLVLALSLGLGIWLGLHGFGSNVTEDKAPKALLSELTLPDVNGQLQHGAQWLGKVVVVNHWASWCPPCIREIPVLLEAQETLRERGLQVVGIAHDIPEAARRFGDQIGINYPSLVVSTGGTELMSRQGSPQGSALPFTAIFDRTGQLARTRLGEISSAELYQLVEPLL